MLLVDGTKGMLHKLPRVRLCSLERDHHPLMTALSSAVRQTTASKASKQTREAPPLLHVDTGPRCDKEERCMLPSPPTQPHDPSLFSRRCKALRPPQSSWPDEHLEVFATSRQ